MVLPAMLWSPITKVGHDVAIYYNLDVGMIKKNLYNGGSRVVTPCGGSQTCPAGSFDATVLTAVIGANQPSFGGLPANAPLWSAFEGEVQPTADGVFADLVCLPNPTNDVLICFDGAVEASPGLTFRPIGRKYEMVDHYVRQRGENTLRISDTFVSNFAGLQRIRGRRCTIIAKIYPAGGGALQEVQYYSNVLLNMPTLSKGDEGNDSIQISAEGNFSIAAIFSAIPT